MTPYTLYDTTTGQVLQSGIADNPMVLEGDGRAVLSGVRHGDGWIDQDGAHHDIPERPSAHHAWDWAAKAWADPRTPEDIMASTRAAFVGAIQKRLDDFARTRNYDNILSACTYATSTVPKFQAEGQYCVEMRDATWAAAYALLAEVEAGGPVPSHAEVMSAMPTLAWPA